MALPFYPYYPADFAADTQHLSNEEVGAYQRLLNFQWLKGSISTEKAIKVAGSNAEALLQEFFVLEKPEGCWKNPRLSREQEISQKKHENRVKAGKSAKNRSNAEALLKQCSSNAQAKLKQTLSNHNHNHNQEKKSKPKKKATPKNRHKNHDQYLNIAYSISNDIRGRLPRFKPPNLEAWADDIRLMIDRDNRTVEEIWITWRWANADPFWQSVILCPAKLRDKFDQLAAHQARGAKNDKPTEHHEANRRQLREWATDRDREIEAARVQKTGDDD